VAAAGLLACGRVDFPLFAYHFQGVHISTAGRNSTSLRGHHGGEWADPKPESHSQSIASHMLFIGRNIDWSNPAELMSIATQRQRQ
jgi:hypothetical protein